jgi:hypothetical protein
VEVMDVVEHVPVCQVRVAWLESVNTPLHHASLIALPELVEVMGVVEHVPVYQVRVV